MNKDYTYYKSRKIFTLVDLIPAIIIIVAIIVTLVLLFQPSGDVVKIYSDGRLIGEYSLNENRTVTVSNAGKENVVSIENGNVYMLSANCNNQICVKSEKISGDGREIICAPHGLVVIIERRDAPDAVTGA